MSSDGTRELFKDIDANRDGKIDEKEFSQYIKGDHSGGVTDSSSRIITGGYSSVGRGGADYGVDASYEAGTVFDQMDLNHDNVIDRSEFNQFIGGGRTVVDTSHSAEYISRYPTDSRGFFLDPHPEIITRLDPGPAPTYTQNIIIRYLQPPPLPPVGENIIREVRASPLRPPSPFVIREGGKPGSQPPPLILRERPPSAPPAGRSVEKTVIVAPLPPPPRSVITERFPNLPDRPRDIILERWLAYEPRLTGRTVRIPAPTGPLPDPPRNRIIEYQPLKPSVVRKFQRLGVTRVDPQVYIQQYGSSLLDSHTFVREARSIGVVEDISPPTGSVVSFASSSYDQGEGLTGTYLGDASQHIISGSSEYSRLGGSSNDYRGYSSSERISRGSRHGRGFDGTSTTVYSDEVINDGDDGGYLRQRL